VGITLGGILFVVLAWLLREPQEQGRDRTVRDSVGQ
jgi:hypothetical protein